MTPKIAKRNMCNFSHTFFLITIIRITRIWLSKVLISIVMMLGKNLFLNIKKNTVQATLKRHLDNLIEQLSVTYSNKVG